MAEKNQLVVHFDVAAGVPSMPRSQEIQKQLEGQKVNLSLQALQWVVYQRR